MTLYNKILHKLFGYDFIQWENKDEIGIAKVVVLPNGKVAYQYKYHDRYVTMINNPNAVIWLTCKPEKYFPNNLITKS